MANLGGQYKIDAVFLEKMAEKLKAIRKKKGYSVEKLSETSKLNPVTIFRIESGKKNFSISSFRDLCKGLSIKPRAFDDIFE